MMSRSYRVPYSAVTGVPSAHEDKKLAARGVRRRQNQWLQKHGDEEDFGLIPHRLECSGNEVYSWGRDGRQYYHRLTGKDWNKYLMVTSGKSPWAWNWGRTASDHDRKRYGVWPPLWYCELKRK